MSMLHEFCLIPERLPTFKEILLQISKIIWLQRIRNESNSVNKSRIDSCYECDGSTGYSWDYVCTSHEQSFQEYQKTFLKFHHASISISFTLSFT